MSASIIRVKPARLDDDCMEVTLKVHPTRLEQFFGRKTRVMTFKGQGNDWYRYPDFRPASNRIAKLLKSINRGWEFRHIQYNYKKQIKKAS